MKITVDGTRYDLGTMKALGISTPEVGGVCVVEAYFGPKSHRLIVERDSIWEDRSHPGRTVGRTFDVMEPDHPGYADALQWALDECDTEHDAMLEAALDEHVPAVEG